MPKPTATVIRRTEAAQAAVLAFYEADAIVKAAQAQQAQAKEVAVAALALLDDPSVVIRQDGNIITGTRVQASTPVLNEAGLKKALGSKVWNALTKRVLDKDKLALGIANGEVPTVVVAAHTTIKESAAYVKLTVAKDKLADLR